LVVLFYLNYFLKRILAFQDVFMQHLENSRNELWHIKNKIKATLVKFVLIIICSLVPPVPYNHHHMGKL